MKKAEQHLQYLTSRASEPEPDYDAMWSRITEKTQRRRKPLYALAAGIVAICIAVPALASEHVDWSWFYRINSGAVTKALQLGMGQSVQITSESDGIAFTLQNLVADELETTLNYTIDIVDGTEYDRAFSRDVQLMDNNGKVLAIRDAKWHRGIGKLVGSLTVNTDDLPVGQPLHLSVGSVTLFRNESIQLPVTLGEALMGKTSDMEHPLPGIAGIRDLEAVLEGDILTVSYRIIPESWSLINEINPEIRVIANEGRVYYLGGTSIFPDHDMYDRDNLRRLERFRWTKEAQDADAVLEFSAMSPVAVLEPNVAVAFEMQGEKIENTIVKTVAGAVPAGSKQFKFHQLVFTPTAVRLEGVEESLQEGERDVAYRNVELQVGDKTFSGYYDYSSNGSFVGYRFQSYGVNGMFTELADEPMTLVWSEPYERIIFEGEPIDLPHPSSVEQFLDVEFDTYTVHFGYRLEGNELFIRSWSDDDRVNVVTTHVLVDEQPLMYGEGAYWKKDSDTNELLERWSGIEKDAKLIQIIPNSIDVYLDEQEVIIRVPN